MNARMSPTFSAVMLAAGTSSRMQGRHKLLLPLGGEPAIRRSARALIEAGPQEVVVVTGFNGLAVISALDGLPLRFQFNPDYDQGQMTSVATGVAALKVPCDVVLVCLADQVLLEADDYRELIDAYARRSHGSIVVPAYGGQRGNPVLFSAAYANEVIGGRLRPGCRKLVQDHPHEVLIHEAAHDRFVRDMDTPEDYASVLTRLNQRSVDVGHPSAAC